MVMELLVWLSINIIDKKQVRCIFKSLQKLQSTAARIEASKPHDYFAASIPKKLG